MKNLLACSMLLSLLSCAGSGGDEGKVTPATLSFTEAEYRYSSTDSSPRPIQLKLNLGSEESKGWGGVTIALGTPNPPVIISSNAIPYLLFYADDSHAGIPKIVATLSQNQDGTYTKGSGKITASMTIGPEMRTIKAETTVVVE